MNSVALAVLFGILIEVFFQLIKYRDSCNKNSPSALNPINYATVSEFVVTGHRNWVAYFTFRYLPVAAVYVLEAGIMQEFSLADDVYLQLMISGFVSVVPRDIICIIKTRNWNERLMHVCNILIINGVIPLLIGAIESCVDLTWIVPSFDGLIDNLWSSLVVALIIVVYIRATDMQNRYSNDDNLALNNAMDNYVLKSYQYVKCHLGECISDACAKYKCSKSLLYAIIINENMNRPRWFRYIENLMVRIFGVPLTVGIAQVKSDRPLSDEDSVMIAAKNLRDTDNIDDRDSDGLKDVIRIHNNSERYVQSIIDTISRLKRFSQTTD